MASLVGASLTHQQKKHEKWWPEPPSSLEEAGVSYSLTEQLILKNLYFRPDLTGRELAKILGFQFSVIEPVLEFLKRVRLVQVKSSAGFGNVSSVFTISENGRARAREYLENNKFLGPAPVSLDVYAEAVRRQRVNPGWLTKERMERAMRDVILPASVFPKLGPAMNSFRSMLIYGKPGNGKSFLCEQLTRLESEPIFIPYVLEIEGQIVKVFDSLYHHKVDGGEESVLIDNAPKYDQRWARCRRPFLTTGGELTMDMLDLMFLESAKIYDAPYQLKANNGIYLIDDFGRQQVTPAELLNRWIYPLDRGVDFLTSNTGTKFEVPFECFLIFSSNLDPQDLGDEAFLRRIEYKMFMLNPGVEEFTKIFHTYCRQMDLEAPADLINQIIEEHYRAAGRKMRRSHPRDLINVAMDLIRYERLPRVLTKELIDRAVDMKFVTTRYGDE